MVSGTLATLVLLYKDDPKIQILTVEGLPSGKERVDAPSEVNPFTKAQRDAMPDKQPAFI